MLRPGIKIAATLFIIVAIAHGLRLVFLVPMTGFEWSLPQWINLMGVILPLVVAALLLLEDFDPRRHR